MIQFIIPIIKNNGAWIVMVLAGMFLVSLIFKFQSLKSKIEKFSYGLLSGELDDAGLGIKFKEICLNFEDYIKKKSTTLVLKTEPNSYLVNCVRDEFEKSYLYKVGGIFTGVSLIFTFLLIGHSVHDIGESLPTISKTTLSMLGNPIKELQEKFYVSIAGILCTIMYQAACAFLMRRLSNYAATELHLREKIDYVVRESQDLIYQEKQAIGAEGTLNSTKRILDHLADSSHQSKAEFEEVKQLLRDLKQIDVTVGNFAENVTTKLEASIDKSIGEKLTQLIQAQNNSTERIANQIGEVLSKSIGQELEKAFSELATKLPNIMSNGAGEATSRMADAVTQASAAFQNVSTTMPTMLTQINSMLSQIEQQQLANSQVSNRVNSDLIQNLQAATQAISSQNSKAVEQQAEIMSTLRDTIRDLNSNVKSSSLELQDSMKDGAGRFSEKVSLASEGISQSLGSVNSILTEVEQIVVNVRESNRQLLSEFTVAIIDLRTVSYSIASTNSSISTTLNSLAEVSRNLNHAPVVTQTLIDNTTAAMNSQRQSIEAMMSELSRNTESMSRTLADQYSRGVEMVARTFMEKIGEIEGQTKNIRSVYSAAGQALTTSMEPLEALSENIQELNNSIKNLPATRN